MDIERILEKKNIFQQGKNSIDAITISGTIFRNDCGIGRRTVRHLYWTYTIK